MIQGYRAPASAAEITGTPTGLVLATSRTLTTAAALPADLSGAVVRIVAGRGAGTVRTIASVSGGTITLAEAEWGVELDATSVFVVVDLVGTAVDTLPVAIADADTPGVRITQTDGSTRLEEGNPLGYDEYTVVLTTMPTADVLVTIRPKATPTLDGTTLRNDVQVAVSTTAAGAVVNADGSITLRFTALNWDTAQTVRVTAVDDAYVDGSDLQAFADSAQRVQQIQGPLFVFGGLNPNPDLRDSDIPPAVMLPGESSGTLRLPTSANLSTIESHQVDTLNVFNGDSVSADSGTLTSTRLTGLGMGGDQYISGRLVQGGITYEGLEALGIHLGHGADRLLIASTHTGTTRVTGGDGADVIDVRTIVGPTFVEGDGGDDTITIGTTAGLSIPGTIDAIDALLTVDGGAGADTVRVDDRADTTSGVARLTQTSLTGLDLVARAGLDALYSLTRPATGGFTITIAGVGAVHFAGTETAAQIELALQNLLFAVTVPATGESRTCGTLGTTRCARSVYVLEYANSAVGHGRDLLIGFRGERNAGVGALPQILVTGTSTTPPSRSSGSARTASTTTASRRWTSRSAPATTWSTSRARSRRRTSTSASATTASTSPHLADAGLDERPQYLRGHLDRDRGRAEPDVRRRPPHAADQRRDGDGGRPERGHRGRARRSERDPHLRPRARADHLRRRARHRHLPRRHPDLERLGRRHDRDRRHACPRVAHRVDRHVAQHRPRRRRRRRSTSTPARTGSSSSTRRAPTRTACIWPATCGSATCRCRPTPSSCGSTARSWRPTATSSTTPRTRSGCSTPSPSAPPVTVAISRFPLVSAAGDGTTRAYTVAGQTVTAYVNGVEAAGTLLGGVFTFATDPAAGALVTFPARTELPAESFALPQVALDSDDDVVHAEQSTLPLVIFGGQGDDTITGGSAADVIFGDRGRVLYLDDALPLPGAGVEGAALAALEATAATVLGHGGPLDRTDGLARGVSSSSASTRRVGGDDVITGGDGRRRDPRRPRRRPDRRRRGLQRGARRLRRHHGRRSARA